MSSPIRGMHKCLIGFFLFTRRLISKGISIEKSKCLGDNCSLQGCRRLMVSNYPADIGMCNSRVSD